LRTTFVKTLLELAEVDERIWLLTGDLGYSVLEPFHDRFPNRYVNVGVAEQNLIGVAAGLALAGKVVFTYSIVNFPVMRALEQIRNDVAYHNLPVTIVTVGGGLVYGAHGYTHHGAEDIGVMRLMPNMRIVVPADPVETDWAVREIVKQPGPTYLRLARGGEPIIHAQPLREHPLGRPIQLREGTDLTLAASGPIVSVACRLADECGRSHIGIAVFSVPALAPLQPQLIWNSVRETGRLLVVEDHGYGGLGTIVAEIVAQDLEHIQFRQKCIGRQPAVVAGSNDFLRNYHGLTTDKLRVTIAEMLAK